MWWSIVPSTTLNNPQPINIQPHSALPDRSRPWRFAAFQSNQIPSAVAIQTIEWNRPSQPMLTLAPTRSSVEILADSML